MTPLFICTIAGISMAVIIALYVQIKFQNWTTTLQASMLAFTATFILFCICFTCALSLERI